MQSMTISARTPPEMSFVFFAVDWMVLNKLYMAITMQVIMGRLKPIRVRPSAALEV